MKKLLFLILFLPLFSFAQEYSEVIEVPNKKSDQLYKKANEWVALTFKSANDVIQLNDPIEMKIIGKGIKKVHYLMNNYPAFYDVYFTLLIQFKDNRLKYNIQSTELKASGNVSYTYDKLKAVTTVEGQTEYIKSIGASPWVIGKKQIQKSVDGNILAVTEIEKELHAIINDLISTLKKEDNKDNW